MGIRGNEFPETESSVLCKIFFQAATCANSAKMTDSHSTCGPFHIYLYIQALKCGVEGCSKGVMLSDVV